MIVLEVDAGHEKVSLISKAIVEIFIVIQGLVLVFPAVRGRSCNLAETAQLLAIQSLDLDAKAIGFLDQGFAFFAKGGKEVVLGQVGQILNIVPVGLTPWITCLQAASNAGPAAR